MLIRSLFVRLRIAFFPDFFDMVEIAMIRSYLNDQNELIPRWTVADIIYNMNYLTDILHPIFIEYAAQNCKMERDKLKIFLKVALDLQQLRVPKLSKYPMVFTKQAIFNSIMRSKLFDAEGEAMEVASAIFT